MNPQTQINNICNAVNKVKLHKATILVGENGSGKSVVRKQLSLAIPKITDNKDAKVKQVSMESRTGVDCIGMHLMADASWEPTSCHTYDMIKSLFASCFDNEEGGFVPYYFIIDELEVGMSRESQLTICNWLKERLFDICEKSYGLMIITHSEFAVEQLKDMCEFIDLNHPDRTADEWITREITPTDFEKLEEDAHELFLALLPKKENT